MILDEELVPLDDAGKYVPGPRRPSRSTLWRWALRGCKGRVLETTWIGNHRVTSREAIRRFLLPAPDCEVGTSEVLSPDRVSQSMAAIALLERKNL